MSYKANTAAVAKDIELALQALVRTARVAQLYSPGNAAYERLVNDTATAFDELLQREPEISVKVRPNSLVWEGVPVLEEVDPDQSIPFALFRDGVRRLDLLRGLSRSELEVLISATSKGFSFGGLGDDIVSYLWRHDLEHVRYLVVDTAIVTATSPSGEEIDPDDSGASGYDLDAQIDGVLAEIYGGGTGDDVHTSIHLDASDLSARSVAQVIGDIDDMEPGLHPARRLPNPPAYASLLLAAPALEDAAVAQAATEVMIGALVPGLAPRTIEQLLDGLLRRFDAALIQGALEAATGVCKAVRRADIPRTSIDGWLDEAASEVRLRQALEGDSGDEEQQHVRRFLSALGPRAVPTLIAILPSVSNPERRRRFSDLMLEVGLRDSAHVAPLLEDAQAFVAVEGVYLLSRIEGGASVPLLRAAAEDPRPPVQLAVLEHLGELPVEDAHQIAIRLIDDDSQKVVGAAATALAAVVGRRIRDPGEELRQRRRKKEASVALERALTRIDGSTTMLEMKKGVIEAFAQVLGINGHDRLLESIRKGSGLLAKKEQQDVAIVALLALRHAPTPKAKAILAEAAKNRSKRIRDAAIMASKGSESPT